MAIKLPKINYNRDGLIGAIIQDAISSQVLMFAWMNEEAVQKTFKTGETWFWSRSRNELWNKGATSGNTQEVKEAYIDCDLDCLLFKVIPKGPACHTGNTSCFFAEIELS